MKKNDFLTFFGILTIACFVVVFLEGTAISIAFTIKTYNAVNPQDSVNTVYWDGRWISPKQYNQIEKDSKK